MKKYSNGNDAMFETARKIAANDEDLIVRSDTNIGLASLQNRSIRLITAFIPFVSRIPLGTYRPNPVLAND